ncbi:MAG: glycosyltransferase [Rhodothermales bacterium]
MKKVLVITYYWPPAGGGGVQRWLKLTKHLPDFGWEPVVYAPEAADYPLVDPTLEGEVASGLVVIRRPIFEPRRLYAWFGGSKERRSQEVEEIFHRDPSERSRAENLAVWLRGNLLIPDARVTWVRPSTRYLTAYLKEHPVDAVVTTGPPHSMHLIGRALKRKAGVPWIADFRDPWTNIEFYGDLMLTAWADARHRRLEASVLKEADAVVTVSPTWGTDFEGRARNVQVIPNGYDEKDFTELPSVDRDVFRLTHAGSLSMDRNPVALWEALASLSESEPGFGEKLRIQMLGRMDPGIVEVVQSYGLDRQLEMTGYVSHQQSIEAMCRAAVLLLLINRDQQNAPGRIPGKLFEYMASKRPILLVGPTDGDAAGIVTECRAGVVCGFDDAAEIRKTVANWYRRHLIGALDASNTDISRYNRRKEAEEFARLLNDVVT